jgi:hypothetical protein
LDQIESRVQSMCVSYQKKMVVVIRYLTPSSVSPGRPCFPCGYIIPP